MARTPTSEILVAIQEVKRLQQALDALTGAVEKLADRVLQLEQRDAEKGEGS